MRSSVSVVGTRETGRFLAAFSNAARRQDGLCREVFEETGALVRPARLTGVYLNLPLGVVAMVFLCELVEDTTMTSTEESAEVRWLSLDEVRARFVPAFAVRVTDAVSGDGETFVRTHDGMSVLVGTDGGEGDAGRGGGYSGGCR